MNIKQQRFLLFQVIDPHYHQDVAKKNMQELTQLVMTYGGVVITKTVQHRVHPHPNTYIGLGKVEWLKEEIKHKAIDVVVINAIVKPSQLYRIEKSLWSINPSIIVWDKMDLILGIFDKHAGSKEAKLQIELARLRHTGPRIYGLGGKELSRQGGGIGQRGGYGETNIEFERRMIKNKMVKIQKELKLVTHQKQSRLRHRKDLGFGPVALVGYTSAGKTTLFNALTGKQKETRAGLFTTLDTVVGKMKIAESPLPILVSDTIGFISDLPPELIDAFKSTLMESMEATLILHVIDGSDPEIDRKVEIVDHILQDLNIHMPVMRVFNKIDVLSSAHYNHIQMLSPEKIPVAFVSAQTKRGLAGLKKKITQMIVPSPSPRYSTA